MNDLKLGHHLLVVRISDSNAMKELEKLLIYTVQMFGHLPGIEKIGTFGTSPLTAPDQFGARLVTGPGHRAVLYRVPGTNTRVLLALGSATKSNLNVDDNAFVTHLAESLREVRFHSLWVAKFDRLLRSMDYVSQTWRAVRDNCRFVRYGGAVLDTTASGAETQFIIEAMGASNAARTTVLNTTVGKMRAYLRDREFPFGGNAVPLGYRKTRDKKLALARPAPRHVIRTIVQVLGDPTLTNEQRVQKVGAAGGLSLQRSRRNKRRTSVTEFTNPADAVKRWYDLLDVWRTGTLVRPYAIPEVLSAYTFDLDVDIVEGPGRTRTWLRTYHLPLPDGGWATDDEFEAAEQLRHRPSPEGGSAPGHRRKPLCGFEPWTIDDHQYVLLSLRKGTYQLRRRPTSDATRVEYHDGERRQVPNGWGRAPNRAGEQLALIGAPDLHASITAGLVDAAEEGLQVQTSTEALLADSDPELLQALRDELAAVRRQVRNATRSSVEASTEAQRIEFRDQADRLQERLHQLEAELVHLAASDEGRRLPVDQDAIARILAHVADQPDHVPGAVADALREVITGLRINPIDDDTANWEAYLRVPFGGGTLIIGPATGTIDLGRPRDLAARRTKSLPNRAAEVTELLLAKNLELEEVAERIGVATLRRIAQTARDHLKALGMQSEAASCLLRSGTATAKKVVWARLASRPFPQGVSQPLAAHLAHTYLEQPVKDRTYSQREAQVGAATSYLRERGGWIAHAQRAQLLHAAGISETTLTYYLDGRLRKGIREPQVLRAVDGGIGLLPCPHDGCDGWATHAVVLPEVPTDLLCPDCRRMPDRAYEHIVFGDDYFDRAP